MCISATAARAFKSVLQGILLSSEGEKLNPMNLLLYMSPVAIALVMEPDVIDVTVSLALKHRFMWLLLLVIWARVKCLVGTCGFQKLQTWS
ncbi:hypothetical protein Hanom_Chr12g01072611 [Helianthus anomalus]